jgi:hypothetical protein
VTLVTVAALPAVTRNGKAARLIHAGVHPPSPSLALRSTRAPRFAVGTPHRGVESHRWRGGGTPEMRKMRGVTLGKAPEKNVEISNYVTSPPSETASDLADFQSRHGEAPRFAGKGREIALVDAGWDDTKVVHPNGCGQARRTSQRGSYPPAGGSDDPPFEN